MVVPLVFLLLKIMSIHTKNDIPSWASNELSYEIFNIMHGKWYRLRISTVDPLGAAQELRFTAGCEGHKVPSNGIWHSVVPFDGPSSNSFEMTGSSRGDFAIWCSSGESINILFGGKLTAIINSKSRTSTNLQNEQGQWIPNHPASIRSMTTEQIPEQNTLRIEVTRDSINGKRWDPDVPLQSLAFNEDYQFQLPDTQRHPFHMHMYHMQVKTPNGCGQHVEGECKFVYGVLLLLPMCACCFLLFNRYLQQRQYYVG